MNRYELLYVIKANLSEEQTAATTEKVLNFLQKGGATIELSEDQGVKKLAYEIEKLREGRFVLVNFTAEPTIIAEATRMLKIDETVIRYIFMKK